MGRTLGPYELESELGRGGMGCVHRARHLPTGTPRAVKVLAGAPDLESLERFRREAQSLARLGGAGVVPVHESGVEKGELWFAMDLMPGGSLRARLEEKGRLPWREAAALAGELARILARCHAAGLVHRDLKPENVLFDEEGRPRLADFGCVRDLGASRLTQSGTVLGTPAYMAPEQLEGRTVDERADVYSLGVVLHELVLGARPYAGNTLYSLLEAARSGKRDRLSELVDAPPALDELLARALEPDARRRSRSAAAFAEELQALAKERPRPRNGAAVVALGAAVLGLLGVFVLGRRLAPNDGAGRPENASVATASSARGSGIAPNASSRAPSVADATAIEQARRLVARYPDPGNFLDPVKDLDLLLGAAQEVQKLLRGPLDRGVPMPKEILDWLEGVALACEARERFEPIPELVEMVVRGDPKRHEPRLLGARALRQPGDTGNTDRILALVRPLAEDADADRLERRRAFIVIAASARGLEAARAAIARALEALPGDPELLLWRAEVEVGNSDPEGVGLATSGQLIESYRDLDPRTLENDFERRVHFVHAQALFKRGKAKDGLAELEALWGRKKLDSTEHLKRAEMRLAAGELEGARADLEAARPSRGRNDPWVRELDAKLREAAPPR